MEQELPLLFVYGSLKRGLANHHQLGDARFAGEAAMEGVVLHDLGPFPMAIAGEGVVHGELYRVDDDQLSRLDRFEGVPRLYERRQRPLRDGRQAWIYLGRPRQVRHSPRLRGGRWPGRAEDAPPAEMRGASPRATGPQGWSRPLLPVTLATLLPVLLQAQLQVARAEPSLTLCQRWQRSGGVERIQLGNAIGAAAYLTKVHPFATSDPQRPQLLYSPTDLRRACDGWG